MEVSADAAYERPCERRAEHNEAGEHYYTSVEYGNKDKRKQENQYCFSSIVINGIVVACLLIAGIAIGLSAYTLQSSHNTANGLQQEIIAVKLLASNQSSTILHLQEEISLLTAVIDNNTELISALTKSPGLYCRSHCSRNRCIMVVSHSLT